MWHTIRVLLELAKVITYSFVTILRQPHLEWENKKCCKQRSELGSEPQTRTTEQNSNGKAESIVVPESS